MGVEGSCRSPNGGVSLFYASSPLYLGTPFCPLALLLSCSIVGKFPANRAKRGKSKDIFACFGVFSGFSETTKGKI